MPVEVLYPRSFMENIEKILEYVFVFLLVTEISKTDDGKWSNESFVIAKLTKLSLIGKLLKIRLCLSNIYIQKSDLAK